MTTKKQVPSDLNAFFAKQRARQEIEELCDREGASFVIDAARAYVARRKQAAAEDHAKWREELIRAMEEDSKGCA